MNYQESTWHGFRRLDFEFEGYPAILVLPDVPHKARRLAVKMEYFDAFPATEIAMLKAGYHLAHIKTAAALQPMTIWIARRGLLHFWPMNSARQKGS